MKRVLFRGISLTTHNILHSYTKTNQNPVHSFNPLTTSTRSRLKFYSSESDSPVEKKPDPVIESALVAEAHVKDLALSVEDVSNKELKTRIKKYFEGDEEALPSILEAILRRKLAGKHEESDDELMDELEKWDEMIKEAVQHGFPKDTKECEEILEDMLSWDKLLPGFS
ncbi:uncharacterized protein LOC105785400 [Gossypium raimondii]|uniref:Uncharacterized protein n=1 Tax=Gossypium raimondii TaxID=29730 RepID=A0A0D2MBB8_GOSRA|nr:uncharacterized protein LOC105785400 [Gossypium raimondii]KJB14962.1 hypothetical protein B456_002G151500 [Gossypium raimondii]